MPAAAEKTREILWGIHGPEEVLWYTLVAISIVVFAYGVARAVSTYRRGRQGRCRRFASCPDAR